MRTPFMCTFGIQIAWIPIRSDKGCARTSPIHGGHTSQPAGLKGSTAKALVPDTQGTPRGPGSMPRQLRDKSNSWRGLHGADLSCTIWTGIWATLAFGFTDTNLISLKMETHLTTETSCLCTWHGLTFAQASCNSLIPFRLVRREASDVIPYLHLNHMLRLSEWPLWTPQHWYNELQQNVFSCVLVSFRHTTLFPALYYHLTASSVLSLACSVFIYSHNTG